MQRRSASGLLLATLALGVPCAAIAQDLAQIRARGFLKIGTSGTAPPNTWVNSKNELIGYDIDWGTMIGRELELPVRWIKVDFRGLMPALSSGQLDLVITGVRIREKLKKVFLFSEPYAYERMVSVVRSDDTTMRTLADIRGRSVGVVAASFQEDTIRNMGGYRELLAMPSGSDVFLSLYTGHVDVAVVGYTAAIHYQKVRPGEVRIITDGGGVNAQGIVMGQTAHALKAAVDRVVARCREDGTYLALYRKNFGIDPPQ
jgi:ABC-type amino acid transport substrate-binding protein